MWSSSFLQNEHKLRHKGVGRCGYWAWHHQAHERTTPFHVSCTHNATKLQCRAQFLLSQKPCEATLTIHGFSRCEKARGNSIHPPGTRDVLKACHTRTERLFCVLLLLGSAYMFLLPSDLPSASHSLQSKLWLCPKSSSPTFLQGKPPGWELPLISSPITKAGDEGIYYSDSDAWLLG